jgi:hypothetical protein
MWRRGRRGGPLASLRYGSEHEIVEHLGEAFEVLLGSTRCEVDVAGRIHGGGVQLSREPTDHDVLYASAVECLDDVQGVETPFSHAFVFFAF